MSTSADWAKGYARQADADLKAWELYNQHPVALAAECHRLLFLQKALDYRFALSGMIVAPAGRAFLKLLRSAINRTLASDLT